MKRCFVVLSGLALALVLLGGCSVGRVEMSASDAGSELVSNSVPTVDSDPDETEPEIVRPEGPTALSDEEIEGIKVLLTEGEFGYSESEFGWGYYKLFSEGELAELEVGLPIYVYPLRSDEPGSYRFFDDGIVTVYPVYRNGDIDGVVMGLGIEGVYSTPDGDTRYNELMALLDEGDCGSIAILTAKDGTYLYDGDTFECLNGTTDLMVFGVGDPVDTGFTNFGGADLPNELLSQIVLTDTSVRVPLG